MRLKSEPYRGAQKVDLFVKSLGVAPLKYFSSHVNVAEFRIGVNVQIFVA